MKKLLLVFGALLVVAGIVSTHLWRNLRTERQANAELRAQFAEAKAAPAAPAPPVQATSLPAPAAVPDKPAAAACASPPVDNFNSQTAMVVLTAGVAASVTGSGEQDLLKNPEYRKAQLTVARLKLAQNNPGLAEALGLSEPEANRLFEVMAEHQLKLTAEITASAAAGGGAPSLADAVRRASSVEDPIRATLGEAKYAQYQEYQRSVRPALTQLASMGSTLTSAGQPLSDSQSRALTTALLAEQQRQRQEAAVPRPNPNPGTPRRAADLLEESYNRQEEGNRRILEAAASSLNSTQLEALRQQFEQQGAQRRRTIESARSMDARPPQ